MDEDGESEDFETKSTDEESEFDEDSYSSDDDDSTAEVGKSGMCMHINGSFVET
jgi:hypothetical protein